MWYWSLTTLATVGYGDYHPISNSEMLVCCLVFLSGTTAVSVTMGVFIDMLMEFKRVTAENEYHGDLSKFLGLLARFNKGHPLPSLMQRQIEEYFDYYWEKDLNFAMKTELDHRFISELPKEITVNVRSPSF